MYRKILVGYVDTAQGREALALGRILATASEAELKIITAPDDHGEDLAHLARAEEADLVVLGSTHRGPIGRVIPGATVERLLGHPPCAVAVAPPGFGRSEDGDSGWRPLSGDVDDPGLRVIGVAYDGSGAAEEALKTAVDLAIPNRAALRVYTVARKFPHVPGANGDSRGPGVPTEAEVLRGMLHEAVAELPSEARALPVFMRGFADDMVIEAVETGVDLLVLGSRAGGPLRRKAHHSITSSVIQRACCPVLIAPSGIKTPEAALA
ncbi:MAG TPA: universal stress protein [Solirubrobacterales bacterium]|nr:universal stress protein [Solirubrobacterales bacterium]